MAKHEQVPTPPETPRVPQDAGENRTPEHRGRISFTEYSNKMRRKKRIRIALGVTLAVLVIFLVAFVVMFGLLFNQVSETAVSSSAQGDTSELLNEATETPAEEINPEVAISMTSLLGQARDAAISHIGHGATVDQETSIDEGGLVTAVQVVLADEWIDEQSGTPTVILKLDGEGKVGSVVYRTPISLLGYDSVSFSDAISSAHMIDNVLSACGVTGVDGNAIDKPSREDFSTYEADGTTLKSEAYTFRGDGTVNESACTWSVNLTYDYTQANTSGNLVDTIRTISVTITLKD